MTRIIIPSLLILGALTSHLPAEEEKIDKDNWRKLNLPEAPVYSPEESLKNLKVPPGFEIQLFAAEPDVINPVAMAWDENGLLYVAEMVTFMEDLKGSTDFQPRSRIMVLEDTNGDGRADRSDVFADNLILPRAVAAVDGGILVGEPPNLWLFQDTNGDRKADKKTQVGNYGDTNRYNIEHYINGLVYGLDNWYYNTNSTVDHYYKNGTTNYRPVKYRGQWGISLDDYGRVFSNTNSSQLSLGWQIYGKAYGGGTHLPMDDKSVNSGRINIGINRGYQEDAMLHKDLRMKKVTAVCGSAIFRSMGFGEDYYQAYFFSDVAANAVFCYQRGEKDGKNILKHMIFDDEDFGKREFITSTDERFRPVNVYCGPDDALYVVDMYHGIIQHKKYLTQDYLGLQITDRKLDEHNNNTGRIYRVVRKDQKNPVARPKMGSEKPGQWVAHLESDNGWWRDNAQRMMVQRGDLSVVPALKGLIANSKNELAVLHAVWTLKGLDSLKPDDLASLKESPSKILKITPEVVFQDLGEGEEKVIRSNTIKGEQDIAQYKLGETKYQESCMACHHMNGKGLENVSPPLVDSDWLLDDDILARVILHGLSGDIHVNGKLYKKHPVMPPHGPLLNDKELAAVMTYIRNSWGNSGPIVKSEDVAKIRETYKERALPWTEKELKK